MFTLHLGDCVEVMGTMADASVDAVVCDPPYGLEFMGKQWDRLDGDGWRDGGGFSKPGLGDRPTAWTSYGAGDTANATCATCGGRMRGAKKCSCAEPDWRVKGEARGDPQRAQGQRMQEWHQRWATEALRVLKPGGHLLAFGGTRTYHRMVCAIEDAGFEIRDSIHWLYGSGFPKSMDVSKAIDKAAGTERTVAGQRTDGRYAYGFSDVANRPMGAAVTAGLSDSAVGFQGERGLITEPATPEAAEWEGWGTALKPAHEPIVVARKPLIGTVATNVLAHGTGALHIDACRVATTDALGGGAEKETTPEQKGNEGWTRPWMEDPEAQAAHAERVRANVVKAEDLGRWPANLVLSHSPDCERVGSRKIKGITGTSAGRMAGKESAVYGGYTGRSERAGEPTGFVDADGTETVEAWECAPDCAVAELDRQSGDRKAGGVVRGTEASQTGQNGIYGVFGRVQNKPHADTGGASRFFSVFPGEAPFHYCAKAARSERNAGLTGPEKPLLWSSGTKNPGSFQSEGTKKAAQNNHPTVKPVALMRWLVRLVARPGATVLDPFVGSGTTGIAAIEEGCDFVGIDANPEYLEIADARISGAGAAPSLF